MYMKSFCCILHDSAGNLFFLKLERVCFVLNMENIKGTITFLNCSFSLYTLGKLQIMFKTLSQVPWYIIYAGNNTRK